MSTNASTTCPSACRNRSPRTLGTMTTVGLLILVQACASHTGRDSTQRGSSQWSYRISPTRQLTFLEMRRYDGLSMQEVTERRFPNAIRHREALWKWEETEERHSRLHRRTSIRGYRGPALPTGDHGDRNALHFRYRSQHCVCHGDIHDGLPLCAVAAIRTLDAIRAVVRSVPMMAGSVQPLVPINSRTCASPERRKG